MRKSSKAGARGEIECWTEADRSSDAGSSKMDF